MSFTHLIAERNEIYNVHNDMSVSMKNVKYLFSGKFFASKMCDSGEVHPLKLHLVRVEYV